MIRMKSGDLSVHSRRVFLLAVAFASLLLARCSSSSNPPAADSSGDVKASNVFGDEISLVGYATHDKNGHTELELQWKTLQKPTADYMVFVHALDSSGAVSFQGDHQLKNAAGLPTSSWAAGEEVSDRVSMMPPAGHAAGAYSLRIGVYTAAPMKVLPLTRATLPIATDSWKDRAILLAQIDCR
jgi:hypothetical protein